MVGINVELEERLRRAYTSIGETVETDLNEFKPVTRQIDRNTFTTGIDFQGNLTPEQLKNIAYSAIHNVANLKDHIKRWAKSESKDPAWVDGIVSQSPELQVIIDLSNHDKHGPPRDGGISKRGPHLPAIERFLHVGGDPANGNFSLTFNFFNRNTPAIEPEAGSAQVLISGDVLDSTQQRMGDLLDYLNAAILTYENLLSRYRESV